MAWSGIVVAPVLMHWRCCSLALCHQCQYASCSIHICSILPWSYWWIGAALWWLQCWHTGVAAVLCCAISVSTQVALYICFILPWSYWWIGAVLLWLQCWHTGVAAVLRCAISVSTQVVLYICCHVTMVILMAWRGIVVAPVLMHWSCSSLVLCHQCQYASCFIHMLSCCHGHIDGLAWNCGSSSADALELLQSCAVLSVSIRKLLYTYVAMLQLSYWWPGVEMW